ncbi:MAG: alpha/beta hydrolase [Sulfurifustaceae bacterium]
MSDVSSRLSIFQPATVAYALLAALSVTGGCATYEPHMMPAPVVFKDDRLDFAPRLSSELRTTRVPVFYAAVGPPVADDKTAPSDAGADDALRFGVADVRLGEPQWNWDDLLASDRVSTIDHLRPGAVTNVDDLGRAPRGADVPASAARDFIARINAQLARANNKELVLYVHGYRVTFDDVAVTMSSFEHYLGHGAMVFFRWPTGVHWWNYGDCDRAERYIPDIENVIALVARSDAQYINLIAYSCGSSLLARALVRLRSRQPNEDRAALARRYRLGNVIFAASDSDFKPFARDYVPPIMDLAQQTIVYMSRNDRALWFSSLVAGGSRLGSPDVAELTPQELERLAADPRFQGIDVSDVRGAHEVSGGARGHGYWYANEWISADVTVSLRYPVPPGKRCLVRPPGRNVWRFPDDYPQCLAEQLLRIAPEVRRTAPGARSPSDPPAAAAEPSPLAVVPQ